MITRSRSESADSGQPSRRRSVPSIPLRLTASHAKPFRAAHNIMVEHTSTTAATVAATTTQTVESQSQTATPVVMSTPPHSMPTPALSLTDELRTRQARAQEPVASDDTSLLRMQLNEALQRLAVLESHRSTTAVDPN